MEFIFGVICGIGLIFSIFSNTKVIPNVKGTFEVRGYKNGELIYKNRYTDKVFIVGPGDKFDKIEIVE